MNELFTRTANSITTRFPGGVRRRLTDKANDVISAMDFGAVGDGATDDTSAIQAAIDHVASNGGGTVLFPQVASYYRVTSIILKSGVCLSSGMHGYGYSPSSVSTVRIGGVSAGWVVDTPDELTLCCGINGISITGGGAGVDSGGVRFRNVKWGFVTNCQIFNFANQAILHVEGFACRFNAVLAIGCLLDRDRDSPSGVIQIESLATDDYLFQIESSASLSARSSENIRLSAIRVAGPNTVLTDCVGEISDIGIAIEGAFIRLSNCRGDLNFAHGFLVGAPSGFASSNQFTNCLSLGNSRHASNTYDGFSLTSSSAGNQLSNCISSGALHRYGFNDQRAGATGKNIYFGCRAGIAVTSPFNFINGGPIVSFGDGPPIAFTSGDVTPSVSQYASFSTNNSSATTITDFDDGVSGQVIFVRCADSNTTIQHNGSTIVLPGALSMKLISGYFYSFQKISGAWYLRYSGMRTAAFVAGPTGGATVDTEARTAVNGIISSLIASGVMRPS